MSQPAPRQRLDGLDLLRGLVIVLMVLDHSRAFLGAGGDPLALGTTSVGWFLTRWVTHLCAPAFVALAGLGAALYARRAGVPATSRYLWTRGLWLVLLEVVAVNPWWGLGFGRLSLLVIWALGVSMVVLGLLARLHRLAPLVFGLLVVLGHNLVAGVDPAVLGAFEVPYRIALVPSAFEPVGYPVGCSYPFLPWAGLMALGWASAPWLVGEQGLRNRRVLGLGAGLVLAFLALRGPGLYGEPVAWAVQPRGPAFTALSFLNCTKYPPSLQYMLVTIGLATLLLPLLSRLPAPLRAPLLTFGRVPLFFYLLHLPLLRLMGWAWARLSVGAQGRLEPSLARVYLGCLLALIALYPLCWAWGRLKATRRWWWLRYL